jgi:hypothetical protein
VRVEIVARDKWETLFRGPGMKNPLARMRMLDGFIEGWIDSPGNGDRALKGLVSAETVMEIWSKALVRVPQETNISVLWYEIHHF